MRPECNIFESVDAFELSQCVPMRLELVRIMKHFHRKMRQNASKTQHFQVCRRGQKAQRIKTYLQIHDQVKRIHNYSCVQTRLPVLMRFIMTFIEDAYISNHSRILVTTLQ